MRRVFAIGCGLSLAIAAALFVFPTVSVLVAVAGAREATLPTSLFILVAAWAHDPERLAWAATLWAADTLVAGCCAPVICTALIGEAAGLRGWFWYVAATAVFSAVLPLAAAPTVIVLGPLGSGGVAAPLLVTGAAWAHDPGRLAWLQRGRRPAAARACRSCPAISAWQSRGNLLATLTTRESRKIRFRHLRHFAGCKRFEPSGGTERRQSAFLAHSRLCVERPPTDGPGR